MGFLDDVVKSAENGLTFSPSSEFLSPQTDLTANVTTDIGRFLSPDIRASVGDVLSPKTSGEQIGAFNLKGSIDTSKKALLIAPQTIINSPFASQSNKPTQKDSLLGLDFSPLISGDSGNLLMIGALAIGGYFIFKGVFK